MKSNIILSKILLLPISLIYGAVMWVRNKLFDWGVLRQQEFDIPVIVVGNISIGGTGKTPLVEFMVEHLSDTYNIAVLSRGYKRSSKGFMLASRKTKPSDIGDEPFQIYNKFAQAIPVAVCENRVKGINKIREKFPKVNLVILDDAFQHRYVKPTLSVVVTEFSRPVFSDNLIPYGQLRESASALTRADIVVVSKCPEDMKACDFMIFKENLDLMPFQHTYFSFIKYRDLQPVFPKVASVGRLELSMLSDRDMVLTVAGIGNPRPFVKYIKSFPAHVWVNVFPDHHEFDKEDIDLLYKRFNALSGINNFIITTEKDAVRIANNPMYPDALKPYTYYLPVGVDFLRQESDAFIANVKKSLKTYK